MVFSKRYEDTFLRTQGRGVGKAVVRLGTQIWNREHRGLKHTEAVSRERPRAGCVLQSFRTTSGLAVPIWGTCGTPHLVSALFMALSLLFVVPRLSVNSGFSSTGLLRDSKLLRKPGICHGLGICTWKWSTQRWLLESPKSGSGKPLQDRHKIPGVC